MPDTDDEVFGLFLEESKEHLESIEDDLLAIEEGGENIDEQVVNKVFRAAHTIKGGAGFFGLESVKSCSHSMENVLGMIRSNELIPTPEIVSVLLDGSDLLNQMIQNPENESSIDISDVVKKLSDISQGVFDSNEPKPTDTPQLEDTPQSVNSPEISGNQNSQDTLEVGWPGIPKIFSVDAITLSQAQKMDKGGAYVFLLKFDLIKDIHRKEKSPWEVIKELLSISYFIDSCLHFESVGGLETESENSEIPFFILCATVLEPILMADCLGLPENQVQVILSKPLGTKEPTPPTSPEKSASPEPIKAEPSALGKEAESTVKPQPNSTKLAKTHTKVKTQPQSNDSSQNKAIKPLQAKTSNETKASSSDKKEPVDTSVRVNLSLLDKLMTLAGELVLTRNELIQNSAEKNLEKVLGTSQRVDSITSELQEAIMATRMQSVGIVFNKFKRVVRDLSKNLGKKINLVLEGEEVELDKTIIEAIGDPMTHLVRNSVDHGIETPEKRVQAGKKDEGELIIKAYHEAGQVVIDISDNGKGIDPEIIASKAIEKGLYTEAQISTMSNKEIVQIVFAAGFSTAEQVTDVSGRGVGMDVVISNLTKVGGVVDIDSVKGQGTTIKIKLPLTLAIIPSILIGMEKERFAIPQVNLLELVRIPAKEVKNKVEYIGAATVMRLRGELLPLVKLSDILGVDEPTYVHTESGDRLPEKRQQIHDRRQQAFKTQEEKDLDPRSGLDRRVQPSGAMQIAVVSTGDFHFGLIVHQLLDTEEIVVKPLGCHLGQLTEYAGATILGDGSVAFILDVTGLCEKANLKQQQASIEKKKRDLELQKINNEQQALLLVRNSKEESFTIPLSLVTRIEKIQKNQILQVGGKRAMTYRGKSLLLFQIQDVSNVQPLPESEHYFVVVYKVGGHEVGVIISEIQDILKTDQDIDEVTHRQPGILGSMVIDDKIVMMLDIYEIADTLAPDLVQSAKKSEEANKKHTVLIVEDSPFFLNQMKSFTEKAGYTVLTAEDGLKGLATLKNCNEEIDMIITDIEMPNMDGLEMVRAIRAETKYLNMPIIAVTSVAGEEAEAKGKVAGIDEYLIKLDREQIIATCERILSGELREA